MNDLTRNPEYDELVNTIKILEIELANLVHDRDILIYHTCPNLQVDYMLKIGKLEYAVFEYQCKLLRAKRKFEIIQSFLNREQQFSVEEIEKQLDKEYQEYAKKLNEKYQEIENARLKKSVAGKILSKDETAELKKLYTQIVKKLHPDINPNTTHEQHLQFNDAVNAYKNGSLSELRIIHLLVEKMSFVAEESTMDKLLTRKSLLLNEKEYLQNEIQKIKNTFPYNIKKLLLDEDLLQSKINELSTLLNDYTEQYKAIENHLKDISKNYE